MRINTKDGSRFAAAGEQRAQVGVLRDEHAILGQREGEDLVVLGPGEPPVGDVHRVVAGVDEQRRDTPRQVLVDEQSHPTRGSSRSCTASAANASAARMSASSRSG